MNAYMQEQKARGGLVNLFNLFSGGALEQMSIFGAGHHAVRLGVASSCSC